jgi:hypothetical protein
LGVQEGRYDFPDGLFVIHNQNAFVGQGGLRTPLL